MLSVFPVLDDVIEPGLMYDKIASPIRRKTHILAACLGSKEMIVLPDIDLDLRFSFLPENTSDFDSLVVQENVPLTSLRIVQAETVSAIHPISCHIEPAIEIDTGISVV
ncbi:MAG TPA: hypothetical protein VF827_10610, partial [Syntrophales bacterium]